MYIVIIAIYIIMLRIVNLLAKEYNFDVNTAISIVNTHFPEHDLKTETAPTGEETVNTPTNALLKIINTQKEKEERLNIWKNSVYKFLPNLQSNNIGNVGEMFLGKICEVQGIDSDIDGTKTIVYSKFGRKFIVPINIILKRWMKMFSKYIHYPMVERHRAREIKKCFISVIFIYHQRVSEKII